MTTQSKFVAPSLPKAVSATPTRSPTTFTTGSTTAPGADTWVGAGVNFDFLFGWKPAIDLFKNFLSTLDKISGILAAILKISEIFINDFRSLTNLLKVLVNKILAEINSFLSDLENSGVYTLAILPEFNNQNISAFPIGGGFNGFKQKVTNALFSTKDPNRPIFSDSASVGGIVLLLSADSTDPAAISDLIHNLAVLENFFTGLTGSAHPAPPVNARATPGFYTQPAFGLTVLGALNVTKKLGVKITWEDNPNLSILNIKQRTTRYYVFRSTCKTGIPLGKDNIPLGKDGKPPDLNNAQTGNGKVILVFGNEGYTDKDLFNGGKAALVYNEPLNNFNQFVDFDVLEDKEYFYTIVPAFGDIEVTYLDRTGFFSNQFGLPSQVVSAKATACIPDRLLNWVEYPRGQFVRSREGTGPFWNSITLKALLGPQADKIVKSLGDLIGILGASIENSSSALQDFQASFSRRIRNYLGIISKLDRLASILEGYKLVGEQSSLMLSLDFKEGGITTFSNRFNAAKIPVKLQNLHPISGITAGVVILFGRAGKLSNDNIRNFSNRNQYQFLPDPYSNTPQVNPISVLEASDNAINIIKGIFTKST